MEFRVLGPVEVAGADGAVELSARKPRALLAALLMHANEVVSMDALTEALWEEPPASAHKLLQIYVSQLRRAIGQDRIRTRSPGYLLTLGDDELDSARFERLVDSGRAALAAGEALRAKRALNEAASLWRGPPYAEFGYDDFARAEVARLEELRLEALEERIEAEIALGGHERVVAELRALVDRHPLRERLWRQGMLALYRSGRQADALEWFDEARRTLRDELGLDPGDALRKLQHSILNHDPALARDAAGARRAAVPTPVAPILGRDDDIERLVQILERPEVRLLTIVGAGGSGKTRLAIELARRLEGVYDDGVAYVELAPVRDFILVAAAIGEAVAADITDAETAEQVLLDVLHERELMLVVDNFEHVADAAPLLVTLLNAAPRMKVLVTSRTVLHVSGGHVYLLEPLSTTAAAELFMARAHAADPTFDRAADDDAVEAVCGRLDCLPLAIELAATRVRTLGLEALRQRLERTIPLLTGGARDLPARQQTLRATLDWSYALLEQTPRRLLERLSVFIGGFTYDAAENVANSPSFDDDLRTLLDASLVQQRRGDGDTRFELLETIREYALERLEQFGDPSAARREHANYVLTLVRGANVAIEGEGPMRHDIVIRDAENVRAALDWAQERDDVELGLDIATALENYWVTNSPREGKRRVKELLRKATEPAPAVRARALRVLSACATISGEHAEARQLYEASLDAYRELGDELGIGIVVQRLGYAATGEGRLDDARRMMEDSLAIFEKHEFAKGMPISLGLLAELERRAGNDDAALRLLERAAKLAVQTGFSWWLAGTLLRIAELLIAQRRYDSARQRLREALPVLRRMADRQNTTVAVALLARVRAESGDLATAGLLWGAIEAEEQRGRIGAWEVARQRYADPVLAHDAPPFDEGRRYGRTLTWDEALERAVTAAGAA